MKNANPIICICTKLILIITVILRSLNLHTVELLKFHNTSNNYITKDTPLYLPSS